MIEKLKILGPNGCEVENGGCLHLCLPIGQSRRICQCTDGFTLINETFCEGK